MTVSTQKMKEVYGQYNKNTVVIPNAIDFSNYPMLVKPKKDNLVRIGLFGSNSHYRDWKTVAGVIKTILEEYPNVRFVCNPWFRANSASDDAELTLIYPDYFDKLREHPQCEWFAGVEIDHYHEWLADKQVDIGIAPLCDSEFNKCKSNIKYLEFSALRIPGVYADLEPYNADVNGGHNGFLASNSSDWLKCLRQLIQSPALRIRMGNLAFQDVKSRYDIKDVVKKLELELHKLMVNVGGLSGS